LQYNNFNGKSKNTDFTHTISHSSKIADSVKNLAMQMVKGHAADGAEIRYME
jgi:hypothetical protein